MVCGQLSGCWTRMETVKRVTIRRASPSIFVSVVPLPCLQVFFTTYATIHFTEQPENDWYLPKLPIHSQSVMSNLCQKASRVTSKQVRKTGSPLPGYVSIEFGRENHVLPKVSPITPHRDKTSMADLWSYGSAIQQGGCLVKPVQTLVPHLAASRTQKVYTKIRKMKNKKIISLKSHLKTKYFKIKPRKLIALKFCFYLQSQK